MPTSTVTYGWTLANAGPAPTVYSLPPSCTESHYLIAYTTMSDLPLFENTCTDRLKEYKTECRDMPTDTALQAQYSTGTGLVPIWSPGPACPSGWKTVGSIANLGDRTAITSSGIFTKSASYLDDGLDGEINEDIPYIVEAQDAIGMLLDPSETLIACCPSSMSTGELGICLSRLPSQSVSTACATMWGPPEDFEQVSTTYFINGTTTTGLVQLPQTTRPPSTIFSTTFGSAATELIAVSAVEPLWLLHKPSDLSSQPTAGDAEATPTGAAATVKMGRSGWGQVQAVAGVLTVSLLAGMAMVLPW
ncbi:hypothetical protein BJY04DRAFT_212291 [Aspergillus karnatakaensis]|uniref:uncharacterized protein n=1 Tax=Aspergillus karnatakaensis TaxID=1810916 RepID=UPI003CCD244D